MSGGSRLDHAYRSILKTKFFTKGWGNSDNLKRLFAFKKEVSNRDLCFKLVPKDYPIKINKEEVLGEYKILDGQFISPFVNYLPNILPKEAETAYFQAVLPTKWKSDYYKPICLHLAGTGDHGFWRRRQIMAKPLLKEAGIGSILLENPFYGLRKPKDQIRSSLHNVSDIFVMGGCLILESLALLHWCENSGYGPLGLTGISMGGHMASLAATNWPKPIVLVPCLSWSTASPVFTEGVMSAGVNWKLLELQYKTDHTYHEEFREMVTKNKEAFRAGQHFAKHFPQSMDRINKLKENTHGRKAAEGKQDCSVDGESNIRHNSENCSCHHENMEKLSVMSIKQVDRSDTDSENVSPDVADRKISPLTRLVPNLGEFKFMDLPWKKTLSIAEIITSTGEKNSRKKGSELEEFMRGIMDECTHLKNFSIPVDTSLIIAVCARHDAYVPREGCTDLAEIWPGVEIRYIDGGHVSAYVLYQSMFRSAIKESFERLREKYYR